MGRVLGVDYGSSRVGLALSDPQKIIASPLHTLINNGNDRLKKKLLELIKKKNVEYIVIGLPIGLKGQETSQTKIVREFAEEIRSLALPVYFQDERLSSLSAKKSLIEQNVKTGHNKSFIDSTAAAIFLQQFLDSKV
jgi:putative Holliday junction resolvase